MNTILMLVLVILLLIVWLWFEKARRQGSDAMAKRYEKMYEAQKSERKEYSDKYWALVKEKQDEPS